MWYKTQEIKLQIPFNNPEYFLEDYSYQIKYNYHERANNNKKTKGCFFSDKVVKTSDITEYFQK